MSKSHAKIITLKIHAYKRNFQNSRSSKEDLAAEERTIFERPLSHEEILSGIYDKDKVHANYPLQEDLDAEERTRHIISHSTKRKHAEDYVEKDFQDVSHSLKEDLVAEDRTSII